MKKNVIIRILTATPLIAAGIALHFAPNDIPWNYNSNGDVVEWSSKWKLLLWPCFVLIVRVIMSSITKLVITKDRNGSSYYSFMNNATIVMVGVFDIISLYHICISIFPCINMDVSSIHNRICQAMMFLCGAILIPASKEFPNYKFNSGIGFRTKWSTTNEEVWAKSQIFAGKAMAVSGVAIMATSFIFKGINSFWAMIIVLVLFCIIGSFYAKWISKKR